MNATEYQEHEVATKVLRHCFYLAKFDLVIIKINFNVTGRTVTSRTELTCIADADIKQKMTPSLNFIWHAINNNTVQLSCIYQRPERSHDIY